VNEQQDPIDAVLEVFLDSGKEPKLDHLSPADRQQAEALITSLRAGRGIDPYAVRPSLANLLAGTRFENWFPPSTGVGFKRAKGPTLSDRSKNPPAGNL
jgi:hypothetical protein